MALILENGRPQGAQCEGRLPKEMRTFDLLDALQIPYQRVDHEAHATMEACAETDRLLGAHVCKNLLLRNAQKTKFYLLMMPGDKKFLTKELSSQIQSARLSFAEPEFMERFLDITPGSLSVLGLMNDTEKQVQLLIDHETLVSESIGVHPCVNTCSLKVATRDLLEKFLPAVHHSYVEVFLRGTVL